MTKNSSVSRTSFGAHELGLLAVVLAAFWLRVWLLDGQSLWGDEAISLGRASGSLQEVAQDARHEGTLPPLYYYVLHFWIAAAGTTEFALRYPSALEGAAAVAVLWAAVRSAGARTALIAALLAALSPFWVYYGQETRMYAQVTLLATVSTALFMKVRAADRGRPWMWLGYVLASAAAVLTHYFAGFVLLAQNLAMGAELLAEWWRTRTTGMNRQQPRARRPRWRGPCRTAGLVVPGPDRDPAPASAVGRLRPREPDRHRRSRLAGSHRPARHRPESAGDLQRGCLE